MNKTIIASVSIVTVGLMYVAYLYIWYLNSNLNKIENKTETKDRLTVCLDIVMKRSIEANKPISAIEAKNICSNN